MGDVLLHKQLRVNMAIYYCYFMFVEQRVYSRLFYHTHTRLLDKSVNKTLTPPSALCVLSPDFVTGNSGLNFVFL